MYIKKFYQQPKSTTVLKLYFLVIIKKNFPHGEKLQIFPKKYETFIIS